VSIKDDLPMVTVVDYGTGNRGSVASMVRRAGARTLLATTPEAVRAAERIVLPGVGAFDTAAEALWRSGLAEPVIEVARTGEVPMLGVCVGMQLLADGSEEGTLPGLGLVPGHVRRLDSHCDDPPDRIPHMGWAKLVPRTEDELLATIGEPRFYFAHSFRYICASAAHVVATARYGCEFPAMVRRGRLWGTQFHPEKSGRNGLQLLRNFVALS
jgi:glutamine amidotransferase